VENMIALHDWFVEKVAKLGEKIEVERGPLA
jgi:hypothetical protein